MSGWTASCWRSRQKFRLGFFYRVRGVRLCELLSRSYDRFGSFLVVLILGFLEQLDARIPYLDLLQQARNKTKTKLIVVYQKEGQHFHNTP